MKVEAEVFNKQPAKIYRAADKGATVEIEHKHYPDRRFLLTAEDKSGYDKFMETLGELDNE